MGFQLEKAAFWEKNWIYGFLDGFSPIKSRFLGKKLNLRLSRRVFNWKKPLFEKKIEFTAF